MPEHDDSSSAMGSVPKARKAGNGDNPRLVRNPGWLQVRHPIGSIEIQPPAPS
jgi:hypothetical protein